MSRTARSGTILVLSALVAIAVAGQNPADGRERALDSESYRLKFSVIGAGGAPAANANQALCATLGQAIPAGITASADNRVYSGFWPQVLAPLATAVSNPLRHVNSLSQNYPNPFNPVTTVEYAVAQTDLVEIRIYNVLGQRVRTLVNEVRTPGRYHVIWNGETDAGAHAASGVYFCRMAAGRYTSVRKLVLLK